MSSLLFLLFVCEHKRAIKNVELTNYYVRNIYNKAAHNNNQSPYAVEWSCYYYYPKHRVYVNNARLIEPI